MFLAEKVTEIQRKNRPFKVAWTLSGPPSYIGGDDSNPDAPPEDQEPFDTPPAP